MKTPNAVLAIFLAVPLQSVQAAYQTMPVKTRQVIIEDGVRRCEVSRPSYNFRVEIVSDEEGLKPRDFPERAAFRGGPSGMNAIRFGSTTLSLSTWR